MELNKPLMILGMLVSILVWIIVKYILKFTEEIVFIFVATTLINFISFSIHKKKNKTTLNDGLGPVDQASDPT